MAQITYEQYTAAKKIVDEYEEHIRHYGYLGAEKEMDDDFDERDWFEEEQDRRDEEDYERACACTCGAWVISKDGRGIHVADCYCGAE